MKFIFIILLIVSSTYVQAVTKAEVDLLFYRLEKLYQQDFKEKKLKLVFRINNDDRVNAQATTATFSPKKRLVILFQGYLDQPCQTYDSILATLCHEIGHHLSRYNKNSPPELRRDSIEGEADYWAAQECLPKYYKAHPKDKVQTLGEEDNEINELCADHNDYEMCKKSLAASYNKVFCTYELDSRFKHTQVPSYKSPDDHKTPWTSKHHPSPQCRLDTHLKGFLKQERPRCWYKKKINT